MYKIIGADQQEYGPVTLDQIRQWITEGRANGGTLVQSEGSTEWVPLSSLPEFADALAAKFPPPPTGSIPPPPPEDPGELANYVRVHEYDLDIGACISRSWELLKEHLWILVGATLIFFVLTLLSAQLLNLFSGRAIESMMGGNVSASAILLLILVQVVQTALSTVMMAGLYRIILNLIRRQPTGIGDFFSVFSTSFVQVAAAGIVVQFLTMLGLLLCVLPGIYLSIAWVFAVPLVIDRKFDFWSAMELSRRVVTQHWWLVLCLVIVVAALNLVGVLACCVGIFAAFPLGLGAILYAYEDIFRGAGSVRS